MIIIVAHGRLPFMHAEYRPKDTCAGSFRPVSAVRTPPIGQRLQGQCSVCRTWADARIAGQR